MGGWTNPKTQRATAFYLILGVLCSNIYHTGLHSWEFAALLVMTGLGTVSGVMDLMGRKESPSDPPGGKG